MCCIFSRFVKIWLTIYSIAYRRVIQCENQTFFRCTCGRRAVVAIRKNMAQCPFSAQCLSCAVKVHVLEWEAGFLKNRSVRVYQLKTIPAECAHRNDVAISALFALLHVLILDVQILDKKLLWISDFSLSTKTNRLCCNISFLNFRSNVRQFTQHDQELAE